MTEEPPILGLARFLDRVVLVKVAVVLGVLALAAAGYVVATYLPRERNGRLTCMNNMQQLVRAWQVARHTGKFDPTLRGTAQIASWMRGIGMGDERIFLCPGDRLAPPDTAAERARWHPSDIRTLEDVHDLCSFAVRDFAKYPVADGDARAWILCDRNGDDGRTMHHRSGINVAFAGGDAQSFTREELGFGPDEPIVVGPDSPNAELRKMQRP